MRREDKKGPPNESAGFFSSTRLTNEEATIKAFVMPVRQERYLGFISAQKHRHKFTDELAHFKHLDPKYMLRIPSNQQDPGSVTRLLTSMGAKKSCWVISGWRRLDAREMDLETALKEIIGSGMGTIISCIPGKLAYFEDEDFRCILRR